MDTDVVAVGAPYDIGGEPGSAYLFDATTSVELALLLPEDDPPAAQFGVSIAINNGIVAVGAYLADEIGTNSGSAYLFDASTGTPKTRCTASFVLGQYGATECHSDKGHHQQRCRCTY